MTMRKGRITLSLALVGAVTVAAAVATTAAAQQDFPPGVLPGVKYGGSPNV